MSAPTDRAPRLDHEWLSRVRAALASADGLIVCLDFDGTLAPIVEDPDDATMLPANRRLLRELVDTPSVTVAVVSGRSLDDLRARVGLTGVHYAGNHGLAFEGPDGREVVEAAQGATRTLDATVETLESRLADVPGCTVEDKGLTATVHTRCVPESAVSTVRETTTAVVDAVDGLECHPGKQIVEVRPAVAVGKDRIVDRLRERRPGACVLAVGDDITDEDAFRAAEPAGFGVLVGDRPTAASVRVPDPQGVTLLLGWLVSTCARHPVQPPS
ncbi:trehalose-phosphatase [Halococcoides cellulosivorans]|uniref:Trehalose 6-phosphate phosphatase n=1 Tax=Halococcoides cellulosivorans TaxID=1679096 RepID=A0A2R4X3F2_9EURY|nr:trehalose-phosphatase [Halococcoides cellulosivorans]AWB28330.1 trehalose-phosphatase [Halococcoides cellulosivorans]